MREVGLEEETRNERRRSEEIFEVKVDKSTHRESPLRNQRRRLVEGSLVPASSKRRVLLLRIFLRRLVVVQHDHACSGVEAQPLVKLRSVRSSSLPRSSSKSRILPRILNSSSIEEPSSARTSFESFSTPVRWFLDEIRPRDGCWTSSDFPAKARDFSAEGEGDGHLLFVLVGSGGGSGLGEEGLGGSKREPGSGKNSCEGGVSVSERDEGTREREREEGQQDASSAPFEVREKGTRRLRTDDDLC